MNRKIQIRRDLKDWSVPIGLYEGVGRKANLDHYTPKRHLSRLVMGVVPPDGVDPGYAAVIGQEHDPSGHTAEPRVWLIDEGVALDPDDFTPAELEYYDIPKDSRRHPTKARLAQAVIALKDLYWPQLVLLPPTSKVPGEIRGDRFSNPFTEFIRRLDGLVEYQGGYGDAFFRKWFPFFRGTYRKAGGVVEVPFEDREYNLHLIDAMLDSNLLRIYEHCRIYLDERLPTARRCVGMVLAWMEITPITFMSEIPAMRDGYAEPAEDLEEDDDEPAQRGEHWEAWAKGGGGSR